MIRAARVAVLLAAAGLFAAATAATAGDPATPPTLVEPPAETAPASTEPAAGLVGGHDAAFWAGEAERLQGEAERLQAQIERAQRRLKKAQERVRRRGAAIRHYRELLQLARHYDRVLERWDSPIPGAAAVAAEVRTGTSSALLLAIAGVESTFGRAACGHNSTGLGACGRAWSAITLCGRRYTLDWVTTWERGLRLTGRLVRCLWPGAETPHDLHGYCSGCPYWAGDVAGLMRLFGSDGSVRA